MKGSASRNAPRVSQDSVSCHGLLHRQKAFLTAEVSSMQVKPRRNGRLGPWIGGEAAPAGVRDESGNGWDARVSRL